MDKILYLFGLPIKVVDAGDGTYHLSVAGTTLQVEGVGANGQAVDTSISWANNDAANTAKDVDVPAPDKLSLIGKYLVLVHNPSTESALTGTIKVRWTDKDGTARVSTLREGGADKTIAIPTNSGKAFVVEGWVLATGGRITFTNDTALGAAGAFTAHVQVRAL